MGYQAYIFDFDYTLGDSTEGIVQCVNYALQQLGVGEKPVGEIQKTIGLSLKNTYRVLTLDEDERNAGRFSEYFKQKADEVMVRNTKLYPGVQRRLEALKEKDCKVGIVTTKFHYRIEQILAKFGAEGLADVIVGGEDVKEPKPSPEGLLQAVERLGVDREQVLYVGDSLVDAETAQRAGIDFAGVLTGTTEEEEFADFPQVCIARSVVKLLGGKTLYVSDLDGTLLRSDETTSEYTNQVINRLTEKGMLFSYATARSLVTSKMVTKGLDAKIPLIVYNGAFVMDNRTEEVLLSNYFGEDVKDLLRELLRGEIYPIVYSYIEGVEKFSFLPEKCTRGMNSFLKSREGDKRTNPVKESMELFQGNIFYITCIDEAGKLSPIYEKYKEQYHCVYQTDIYTKEQWLEIMPLQASKAAAIKQLKEYLGCERLVVFGDGKNDIDMFELADECYAVENSVEELKAIATDVIGNHDEDGVVKWLETHYEEE